MRGGEKGEGVGGLGEGTCYLPIYPVTPFAYKRLWRGEGGGQGGGGGWRAECRLNVCRSGWPGSWCGTDKQIDRQTDTMGDPICIQTVGRFGEASAVWMSTGRDGLAAGVGCCPSLTSAIVLLWLWVSLLRCLPVCLSVSLPVCWYACLLDCPSACLSTCLFVCLPACLPVRLPACMFACLLVCLSACLSRVRVPLAPGFFRGRVIPVT